MSKTTEFRTVDTIDEVFRVVDGKLVKLYTSLDHVHYFHNACLWMGLCSRVLAAKGYTVGRPDGDRLCQENPGTLVIRSADSEVLAYCELRENCNHWHVFAITKEVMEETDKMFSDITGIA